MLLKPFDRREIHAFLSSYYNVFSPAACSLQVSYSFSCSSEPQNFKNHSCIYIFYLTEIFFFFAQGQENWVCPGHCALLWVKTRVFFFLITVSWFTVIHRFPCCLSHQVFSPLFSDAVFSVISISTFLLQKKGLSSLVLHWILSW